LTEKNDLSIIVRICMIRQYLYICIDIINELVEIYAPQSIQGLIFNVMIKWNRLPMFRIINIFRRTIIYNIEFYYVISHCMSGIAWAS